jgi:hypothetical protein
MAIMISHFSGLNTIVEESSGLDRLREFCDRYSTKSRIYLSVDGQRCMHLQNFTIVSHIACY